MTRLDSGLIVAVRLAALCGSLARSGDVAKPLRLRLRLRSRSLTAAWLLAIVAQPALAAPVLPADTSTTHSADPTLSASRPGLNTPGIINDASNADVPNQSKTIEMLLEMQGKNPGLAGGERPRQEMPTGARTAAVPAAPAPSNPFGDGDPANPFGAPGMAPDKTRAAPQDTAVDWSVGASPGLGGGALGSSASPQRDFPGRTVQTGSSHSDETVRSLIPLRIVRFVRENREAVVIGSVVVLLLLWGATAMASGRRK